MKKLIQISAVLMALCTVSSVQAQTQEEAQAAAAANCPAEHPAGECWCKMVRYEPCYTTTYNCCEERIPCTRKCFRRVPVYSQVQCCRMVPQYYCKTVCSYKTECYDVPDCKICRKMVPCCKCHFVPKCFWKQTCAPQCGAGNDNLNTNANNIDNSNLDNNNIRSGS